MKKSELMRYLESIMGDPEVVTEDRHFDGSARPAQVLDEVWAVSDPANRDSLIFWERDDKSRPATYPGDSPDDPAPVIALVLR